MISIFHQKPHNLAFIGFNCTFLNIIFYLKQIAGASSAALKSNTPPIHQQTSSSLLATNASEPAFDLGGSMAKINTVDSKPKVKKRNLSLVEHDTG